jgi:L-ribulose-5-phosphate 3-epimerase
MDRLIENRIGVMQGRLLPKYNGRYQAHPVGYWQEEFLLAEELGLGCIEFILDYNDAYINPLLTPEGRQEILNLSSQTGVRVLSICADYFMEAPLHSKDARVVKQSFDILNQLLTAAKELDIRDIVIPCVDHSSIQDESKRRLLQKKLFEILPKVEEAGVNLALETDLNPSMFGAFLKNFKSDRVTVNYDTGNSAALGYNTEEEFRAYGQKLTDIHIKDRKLSCGSVVLGVGDWDYNLFFMELKKINFKGHFIMQAFRDDEGLEIFKEQLAWLKEKIAHLYKT